MTRVTDGELIAGRRADFHVYYRRNGKLYFDPIWADSETEARANMLGFARELRWTISIVRVERVQPDA